MAKKKTIGAELIEAMRDALAYTKGKRRSCRVNAFGHATSDIRPGRRRRAIGRTVADNT